MWSPRLWFGFDFSVLQGEGIARRTLLEIACAIALVVVFIALLGRRRENLLDTVWAVVAGWQVVFQTLLAAEIVDGLHGACRLIQLAESSKGCSARDWRDIVL